jgi:hypothetical protein
LQGELDVSDFTYKDIGYSGVRIFLHPNINHSKLKIINKPNGSEITQLKDVQK